MGIYRISENDKIGLLSIVGSLLEPLLYSKRFDLFVDRINRRLSVMRLVFNLGGIKDSNE